MTREAVVAGNERDAQDYHELCKKNVLELIKSPYENRIKLTMKTIYETGKEKACIHCFKLGEYADALYKKDEKKASEIEKGYRIQPELKSCTVML
ncbi:MAG: hypothetical protein NTW30_03275 [Candidatus Aenigmarchaeota archaeon]|nr:hypothetical protein [Candidatus Aenigmarchaeota archaeon]